jgi:hypothetical protein
MLLTCSSRRPSRATLVAAYHMTATSIWSMSWVALSGHPGSAHCSMSWMAAPAVGIPPTTPQRPPPTAAPRPPAITYLAHKTVATCG